MSDVTRALRRSISPARGLFVQKLSQANNWKNSKAGHYCIFVGKTITTGFPLQRASDAEHVSRPWHHYVGYNPQWHQDLSCQGNSSHSVDLNRSDYTGLMRRFHITTSYFDWMRLLVEELFGSVHGKWLYLILCAWCSYSSWFLPVFLEAKNWPHAHPCLVPVSSKTQ